MKELKAIIFLIIYLTVMIGAILFIMITPIRWIERGIELNELSIWIVITVLVFVIIKNGDNNNWTQSLIDNAGLFSILLPCTIFVSCSLEHGKTYTITENEYNYYQKQEKLISAYQNYYFHVESLLDSIENKICLEDTYFEGDCGADYLYYKYELDSLESVYNAELTESNN